MKRRARVERIRAGGGRRRRACACGARVVGSLLLLAVVDVLLQQADEAHVAAGVVALLHAAVEIGRRGRLLHHGRDPALGGFASTRRMPCSEPDLICFGRSSTGVSPGGASTEIACGSTPLRSTRRRGGLPVREHHRVDAEGRHRLHALHALHLLHDRAVLAEVGRVLQDEDVRVDAEDLLAELLLEAPVTLMTVARAATPSVTPGMAKAVPTRTRARFFDPR
ncbi:MAG: hypothetical protein R3F14_10640 [Polyangiaceae bacterium]